MTTTMVVGAMVALLAVGVLYLLSQFQKKVTEQATEVSNAQLRALRENFETMQRNLVSFHTDFEKLQEAKAVHLRTELSTAFQNTRKELQDGLSATTQTLEKKVGAMDDRVQKQLGDMSTGVQAKLEMNLKEGFRHFEKVTEGLKNAEQQLLHLNQVGTSIHELNNLLKLPHLRGNFGEAILEQLLNDLLPQDAYELQFKVVPNSTERVDAVIKYPDAVLPVDSKFPREQVLALFDTADPARLEAARKSLTDVMRTMAKSIRDKYIHPEHGTTDMALLFVPSETLYFEILRNPKLCDELSRAKVFMVSPNTFSVTLHAISVSRRYYEMAKGIEKTIADLKKAEQHFENFNTRFLEIGKSLEKAQTAFSTATTHLSRYQSAATRLYGKEEARLTPETVNVETKDISS